MIDSCEAPPSSRSTRPPPSCLPPRLPEAECGSGDGTVRAQGSACGRLTTSSGRHRLLSIQFQPLLNNRDPERDGWTVAGVRCRLRHRVSGRNRSTVRPGGLECHEGAEDGRGLSVSAADRRCCHGFIPHVGFSLPVSSLVPRLCCLW